MHICKRLLLEPPSRPPSHAPRSSQSARLRSLYYAETSHQLSILHLVEDISQGWGSLVGCCLWGHTESDATEVT